ncbi:MAG: formylglycine-generating enzyme family protein, partial [Planctomycetota bacterium]
GTAEADVVLRYWQSLTGRALERLADDFRAAAVKELPRLKAVNVFPLAGPSGKNLSPDQITEARRAFDRLRINPRGLPVGAIGRGGKTGVARLDAALAKLAAYQLPGAAGEWLVTADRVLAGLPDAEPLECEVALLSTDEQNALLDKEGKSYGSHSAVRIWRSIALFQGGRARAKPAKTEQVETVPLGKLSYPGGEVRLDFHKFSDVPADRTIKGAGPWGCILLLHEHGAKRSQKDGRVWHVGLSLKDDVGRKRVLWLKLTFARELPALEDWPSSVGVDLTRVPDKVGPRPPRDSRLEAARLLADAQGLRRRGRLDEARAKLAAASAADPGNAQVARELAGVRAEIAAAADASAQARAAAPGVVPPARPGKGGKDAEFDGLLAAATAAADAGRYRQAWKLVGDARKLRSDSPRLKALAGRVVRELAPKRSAKGPLGIELILIRGGTFSMGREDGEPDERPVRRVTVSSFYLGRLETTRAQFEAYRKKLPRAPSEGIKGGSEPVVSAPWDEASRFCRYLSDLDRAKPVYRLPTEAEWEFAARGAEGRNFPWGSQPVAPKYANVAGDADRYVRLAPVGSFPAGATPEGLLDMFGNAGEWCRDWYAPYSPDDLSDPGGPAKGKLRTARGSSYAFSVKEWPASSTRGYAPPDEKLDTMGFRVLRELTSEEKKFEGLARNE